MLKKYLTKLYIPAISIITVVLILLIILIVSTQKNLNRQKKIMEEALHEKGSLALRSLDSSIAGVLRENGDLKETLSVHAPPLLDDPDLLYVYVVTPDEEILFHSDREKSRQIPFHRELTENVMRKGTAVKITRDQALMEMGRKVGGFVEVAGLDMKRIKAARKRDINHAIFMGMILLSLGTASIYFVFMAQNYYLVNRALERMRSFTDNVMENMPSILISVDPDGKIVTINKAAKNLLNLTGKETGKMGIFDILRPEDSTVHEALERDESAYELEGLVTMPGITEKIPISVSASHVYDSSRNRIGSVYILRDLRDIKSLQAKVIRTEKLAMAGTLASGLAHEIRNPLSSIRGFVHFFKKHFTAPTKEREYLDLMISEIDRVNRTIADLLNLSRPKELEFKGNSILEAVKNVVSIAKGKADEAGVVLKSNLNGNVPSVYFDADQVHQALLNIVINAIEATPPDGTVHIGVRHDGEKNLVLVEVSDTGSGIDKSVMERLFDPFFTSKEKGTGLGLALVQSVMEMHGWDISVDSKRGEGTQFTISIPVEKEGKKVGQKQEKEEHPRRG